ncbi:hypothetical protein GCK72_018365 [Caenorhabditis remanei]|uniref:Uncharacterized protein n=1 Tax=Caenorhabditis remanei TaxID=31234 RepID=A0A6A5GAJ3_CAERE|nr:hypothetical protein GCK72_018365 [Caenorhabditis remanei]KAF1751811.1 hypothetical protein GCK72_018365 [Caenorhabditis remanei]
MSPSLSESDIAYLKAVQKAHVFQQLTDSVSSDFGDDVVVDSNNGDIDVDPIVDKAKELLGAVDEIMAFELDNHALSTSSSLDPSNQSTEIFMSDAAFKFWFVVLLICFLFISVGIFHFFCIGQKNVTRRNSLNKKTGEETDVTTMEMITEEIEMEGDEEIGTVPNRLVLQDF